MYAKHIQRLILCRTGLIGEFFAYSLLPHRAHTHCCVRVCAFASVHGIPLSTLFSLCATRIDVSIRTHNIVPHTERRGVRKHKYMFRVVTHFPWKYCCPLACRFCATFSPVCVQYSHMSNDNFGYFVIKFNNFFSSPDTIFIY